MLPTEQVRDANPEHVTPDSPVVCGVEAPTRLFQWAGISDPGVISAWAPPVCALLAAGSLVWSLCRVPPLHRLSGGDLIATAAFYVCLGFAASAVTILGIYTVLPRGTVTGIRSLTLRTSTVAVWFAPASVFVLQMSLWAAIPACILAAGITSLLWSHGRALYERTEPEIPCEEAPHDGISGLLLPASFASRLLPALCASAFIQSAAPAALAGYWLPATVLFAAGAAFLAGCFTALYVRPRRKSPSLTRLSLRALLMVTVAAAFTVGGLVRYLELPRSYGPGTRGGPQLLRTAIAMLYHLFSWQPVTHATRKAESGSDSPPVPVGASYPGVILLPESAPHTILLPPLPATGSNVLASNRFRTVSIPFFGVYQFFRMRDQRLPPDAVRSRGSPVSIRFRSTDGSRLSMEARQNFGMLLSVRGCGAIQVEIRNGDYAPETISLELILVNTTIKGQPRQSLGRAMVKSTPRMIKARPRQSTGIVLLKSSPDWKRGEDRRPPTEVLTFPVPAAATIREFDEIVVRFHLDSPREDQSAKIAIDRFRFVPKSR